MHLSRRRWPSLPTYLSIYEGMKGFPFKMKGSVVNPFIYEGDGHLSRRRWPLTSLPRRSWPSPSNYPSICEGKGFPFKMKGLPCNMNRFLIK